MLLSENTKKIHIQLSLLCKMGKKKPKTYTYVYVKSYMHINNVFK